MIVLILRMKLVDRMYESYRPLKNRRRMIVRIPMKMNAMNMAMVNMLFMVI